MVVCEGVEPRESPRTPSILGALNNPATELESKVTYVIGKRGLISMKVQRMGDDKIEQGKFMRDLYQGATHKGTSSCSEGIIPRCGPATYG